MRQRDYMFTDAKLAPTSRFPEAWKIINSSTQQQNLSFVSKQCVHMEAMGERVKQIMEQHLYFAPTQKINGEFVDLYNQSH